MILAIQCGSRCGMTNTIRRAPSSQVELGQTELRGIRFV